MKIAIVYKSITGNTKKLAEAIRDTLKDEEIIYFGEPIDNIDADLYIVGSWTDKGDCDVSIADFLRKLKEKKIIYFGTAGFGGSSEYYNKLFDRVKQKISNSNEILGYFYCQGRMPMSVRGRYVNMIKANPSDKNLQLSIENFDNALSHPNSNDLKNIEQWIKEII